MASLLEKALKRLEEIDTEMAPLEAERAKLRAFVNQACELEGEPPMFPDLGTPAGGERSAPFANGASANGSRARTGQINIKSDQFFKQPLATAARRYLDMRRDAGAGPASTEEIHEALVRGGFHFPTSDTDNQKRGLQVSLSKNSQTFAKLPNDLYGLTEWY